MDLCNPLKTDKQTFMYNKLKTILDKFNHIVLNMQLSETYNAIYLTYIIVMFLCTLYRSLLFVIVSFFVHICFE